MIRVSIDNKIRNRRILRNSVITPSQISSGSQVKHLGYGKKYAGKNLSTGQVIGVPGAAFGVYGSGTNDTIKIRSACEEGDSGGPLFLNRGKGISIIGVIIKGRPLKKGEFQKPSIDGNTTAVPIQHVSKILNSQQMKSQVLKGLKNVDSLIKLKFD